jgi:hypothetical protein
MSTRSSIRASALLILTNYGDAEDFRIARAPIGLSGQPTDWQDVVPHVPGG